MTSTTIPRLTELHIGDDPAAWSAAGFAVVDGVTQVGHVLLRFTGTSSADASLTHTSEPRGIHSWAFDQAIGSEIDGVPTVQTPETTETAAQHPNGVNHFDHVVLMSPDSDRTTAALTALGFEVRGVREYDMNDKPMRQTFFWMGDVILELVGPRDAGEGYARLWGLAFSCPDLDGTVASLGERSSEARTAIQPGRRIASLRHKDLNITVPVAFMTPHPKSTN